MKFEDVKNVKVGDNLCIKDVKLCENLMHRFERGEHSLNGEIKLTVEINDNSNYKPFKCSMIVDGVYENPIWISYEAVELIYEDKPNFKSGDKVVRTGRSVPDLSMINGEVYTINHVYNTQGECIITLEECYNNNYHYTFSADNFKLLGGESNINTVRLEGEVYAAQDILGESIYVEADNRATPSGGGSASYYKKEIPKGLLEKWKEKGVIETSEVIRLFLGNDFTHGNIFKASCRIIGSRNGGGKKGVSEEYDLDKQVYFAEDDAAWNELFK